MVNYILIGVLIGSIAKDIWNFIFDISGVLEVNLSEEDMKIERCAVFLDQHIVDNIAGKRRVTLKIDHKYGSQE